MKRMLIVVGTVGLVLAVMSSAFAKGGQGKCHGQAKAAGDARGKECTCKQEHKQECTCAQEQKQKRKQVQRKEQKQEQEQVQKKEQKQERKQVQKQEQNREQKQERKQKQTQAMIQAFDADEDGNLSKEELKAARELLESLDKEE